jgi:hypothetical protein
MTPIEFVKRFKDSLLIIKGGAFSVWGTSFGKFGDNFYKIEKVEYNSVEDQLEIFTDYVKVSIWNPVDIFENPSKNQFWPPFLEIKNANRILLEYTYDNQQYYIDFDNKSKQIDSNSRWYKDGKIEDKQNPALIFG